MTLGILSEGGRPEPLRTAADVGALIAGEPGMANILRAVAALGLPDAWVGAGFVRNAVWDTLHGYAPNLEALADVDVVFFDPGDTSLARERAVEAALAAALPGVPWSARNQARMHARNGDGPYADTADALRHWPETATAIAARPDDAGRVALLAPYGLGDLLGLVLRPTPPTAARPRKMAEYRARVRTKGWLGRWPRLVVLGLNGDA